MVINSITQITAGKWVVSYNRPMSCGCGMMPTEKVIIKQLEKPTKEDAIRSIKEQGKI